MTTYEDQEVILAIAPDGSAIRGKAHDQHDPELYPEPFCSDCEAF